jgi:20S proteasome subunit beta 2
MGSGSLAAMSVLESRFKDGMTQQEATDLLADAIEAGIFNDMGSGSNVDVVTITKEGANYQRKYRSYNRKAYNST